MDIIKALQYLNSTDGPHISIEKLAIYCGISKTTMYDYIREKYKPSPAMRVQLEKGITDLIKEIQSEWPI